MLLGSLFRFKISMLIASNFSSWDVASEERREENSTVFVLRGLNEAAPDRNLVLLPYLLGFREGIATRPGSWVYCS